MNGSHLYAMCLNYPHDGHISIKSLAEQDASCLPKFHGIIDAVDVLGFEETPVWKRTENGLEIETRNVRTDKPVVFKITMR